MAIKFGTDGWRGIIADDFTVANVCACAQGLATYLKDNGLANKSQVIGYDTRFASEHFASVTAEVLAANGIKVFLSSGAVPTPVTSFGVASTGSGGAVVITASHNPPEYNGFKVKTGSGASAPPEMTTDLERRIVEALSLGNIKRVPIDRAMKESTVEMVDLMPPYLEQVSRLVDVNKLRQRNLNVAVDSMYGAGAGYLRKLLSGGRVRLTEIHAERNPIFPGMRQPEPISHNLTELAKLVPGKRFAVGLATDGDADRVGVMDENGQFLTQLQVFALLCYYLLEIRGERGALVKTTTTTSMIFRLADLYGVKAFETPVGFKYVAPVMMSNNALVGGEESGGYGFRGHIPERDGILAALYFLDFMARTGKTPSQLLELLYSKVGPHYYDRIDLTFEAEKRQRIVANLKQANPARVLGKDVVRVDRSDGLRLFLSDNSWLFMRLSGTEPVLRIYAESPSEAETADLLKEGRRIAEA
ncbi:MAG: phosphoglucomutase/phosphomannomutase family protein [Chloroflexi bacterium]|nr:phosphoglucomutase/phosphomannomutase family protein [Chloroflexota bacterium]